jgi:Aspartyl/Asparaginyl beta-hydroxylase
MSGLEWWLLRSSEIPTTLSWIAATSRGADTLVTAFFSIMSPHKHIPPHRGPYRGVVRCHLGLMVPGPPHVCGISVGGEVRHWREGETMFFDDGYEHFAWNDTDSTRVVLFLDVIRPLRRPAANVNKALLRAISWSPFPRAAKRRHQAWESGSSAWLSRRYLSGRGRRAANPGRPDHSLISIRRERAWAAFGTRTVRTPSVSWAWICSGSASAGRLAW